MRRLVLLALLADALTTASARSQSVDRIVEGYLTARGGRARLQAVRTVRLMGRIVFANGETWADTVELARPASIRTELTGPRKHIVQAFDGHAGWMESSLSRPRGAHRMEPGLEKNVAAGADFDGAFVDAASKGNSVTFAGIDTADGRPAFVLAVRTGSGLEDTYFVDTVTYRQTKWLGHRTIDGRDVVFESYFRDWRPVHGVWFAFRIDSGTQGTPGGQHIIIDRVELNAPEPASRFVIPAPRIRTATP